jgi:hypothetical protein
MYMSIQNISVYITKRKQNEKKKEREKGNVKEEEGLRETER